VQRPHDDPGTDAQPVARRTDPVSSHRLGWLVIDALKDLLPERALPSIYMHLGCRHYRRAIAAALEASAATGTVIPDAVATEIACWLNAYAAHPDQQRLRRLLADARRPPDNAVSSPPGST
jgi:hypothetical protein